MELRCEDERVQVVIDSCSYYFNWIVPIQRSGEVQLPELFKGYLNFNFWSRGKQRMSKPTLVLDLELTIAYCKCLTAPNPAKKGCRMWGVAKRPGLDEFLQKLSSVYEIVTFTAADQMYADAVLQLIDPKAEHIQRRLYEQHLSRPDLLKDISVLGRDASRIVVVDDVPAVYGEHSDFVIGIAPFTADGSDDDGRLLKLADLLESISQAKDLRQEVVRLKQSGALAHIELKRR